MTGAPGPEFLEDLKQLLGGDLATVTTGEWKMRLEMLTELFKLGGLPILAEYGDRLRAALDKPGGLERAVCFAGMIRGLAAENRLDDTMADVVASFVETADGHEPIKDPGEAVAVTWKRSMVEPDLLEAFLDEGFEMVAFLDKDLIELEKSPDNPELLNRVFRHMHSLKGNSGMIGLGAMQEIAHRAENILDRIRKKTMDLTPIMIDVMLECVDFFRRLLEDIRSQESVSSVTAPLLEKLAAAAEGRVPEEHAAPRSESESGAWDRSLFGENVLASFVDETDELVGFLDKHFLALEKSLNDPELLNAVFRTLHTLKSNSAVVGLGAMSQVAHQAETLLEKIRDGALASSPPIVDLLLESNDIFRDYSRRIKNHLEMNLDTETILSRLSDAVAQAIGPARVAAPTPVPPTPVVAPPPKPSPAASRVAPVRESPADSTSARSGDAGKKPGAESASLRIDIAKLDSVMNLVGEIVIDRIRLNQKIKNLNALIRVQNALISKMEGRRVDLREARCVMTFEDRIEGEISRLSLDSDFYRIYRDEVDRIREIFQSLREGAVPYDSGRGRSGAATEMRLGISRFREALQELEQVAEHLNRISSELQEGIIQMRMVPISHLFDKVPRLVRSLSKDLGKKVTIEVIGAETDLDKTVVERLGDPLTHLIRNSLDHGIETPAIRAQNGKPEEGCILLKAEHKGNQVIITITDDGRGIDERVILEKAVKMGLVPPERAGALQRNEILDLIFLPGFSSAESVTEVSGRGVGMDVVLNNIKNLKGTVEIDSVIGKGTIITIRLPLTMAIMEVQLVRLSGRSFAIPINFIEETLRLGRNEIMNLGRKTVFNLRGEFVSLVHLRDVLEIDRQDENESDELLVLIVVMGEKRIGFVIDKILGQEEIVIKTLGSLLRNVNHLSGATILGEGTVVPILDVLGIFATAKKLADISGSTVAVPTLRGSPVPGPKSPVVESAGRILVVDDSTTVRKSICTALRDAGYATTEAVDGPDAIVKASEQLFDLVTVDVVMPRMSGYEVTRTLRTLPRYAKVPIIIVSSKSEKIDKFEGLDAGADDYISKPFERDALVVRVREILGV